MNALLAAYPHAPEWFEMALLFNGMKELTPNGELEPRVRAFFEHTHFPRTLVNKETAWCAAFACAMLERTGYKSPQSAAARDFAKWGKDCTPTIGALVVIPRSALQKHVTFYAGPVNSHQFLAFGGNQGDSACMKIYDTVRIEACRWPAEKRARL